MELTVLNPWWKGKEYIREDKHIKELESMAYKWKPKISKEINLLPGNIFSLRGPRQIGKTTLIKSLIAGLLTSDTDEKSIFYWSCDNLVDYRELTELIREYIEFSNTFNIKERYIFLDEISDIRNWQKAIKFLVDSGELNNSCIFLTGSHTLDVKYGFERLPGRTGKHGKDYLLLPLTFREFIDMVKPDITKKIGRINTLSKKDINKELKTTTPFQKDLKILFNKYLITGGFPLTINEFLTSGKIPDYVYDLYSSRIIGDIVKWRKQEKILKQVMRAAIQRQGTPISWDSLAKEAEIKSHKTISSYVEDLENMFVLSILYFIDLNKKIPVHGKNKKIYFSDPFIYHVFNKLTYFKTEVTPSLIEATCVTHLERFLQTDSVFYWKNKREVDVVLKTNGLLAVEIKYQQRISREDWMPLFHFKKGILLTKGHIEDKGEYLAIPIHLFLSMI